MNTLMEACVVLLTLSVTTLTVVGLVTLRRFGQVLENADRSLYRLESLLDEAGRTLADGRELLGGLGTAVTRLDAIANDAGRLSHRVVGLSEALLNEVEAPARRLLRLSRGVKAAASTLWSRWSRRTGHEQTGADASTHDVLIANGRNFS